MKQLLVLLCVLSAALAAALWRNHAKAASQMLRAETGLGSLSNRLVEAEMKLNHQERINQVLGGNLTNCMVGVTKTASELAAARDQLLQAKGETRARQEELQSALAQAQLAKSEISALSNQCRELSAELRHKDTDIKQAQALLAEVGAARVALAHQVGELQQQNDRLQARLHDPDLLRGQIRALELQQAAASDERQANGRPDYRLPLELLPDGSVRLVFPCTNSAPLRQLSF